MTEQNVPSPEIPESLSPENIAEKLEDQATGTDSASGDAPKPKPHGSRVSTISRKRQKSKIGTRRP